MTLQEAIRIIEENPGLTYEQGVSTTTAQEMNTATRILADYWKQGGDVSVLPASVRQYATPEYSNFVDSRGSGTFADVLPLLSVAGGGLAGVFGGAGVAAGAGTEASNIYGAGGEFGAGSTTFGAAAPTLAEQAASIGAGAGAQPGTSLVTAGGSAAPATTAGTIAGTAAGGTALSRILGGSGTTQDWLAVTGQVAPSLLGMYGASQQAGQLGDLASQYVAMGQPYRDQLATISQDPQQFYESPQAKLATEAVLRRLSIAGNPAGNPYSQAQTVNALFGEYGRERDRLAGFGGLTQYNAAAPQAAQNAAGAQGQFWNQFGRGLGNVLNPQPTLAQVLAGYTP